VTVKASTSHGAREHMLGDQGRVTPRRGGARRLSPSHIVSHTSSMAHYTDWTSGITQHLP
jgi:hypothetical protein